MKDYVGSKTTYYSLAKDKLKGKHPRIYNLILIFTLLSLTSTAAFLISDILSFGINFDNPGVDGSKGLPGPEKSSLFPSLTDSKASPKAEDAAWDSEPTLSVLDANSSPGDEISSQLTANSTGIEELGKDVGEQNSSHTGSIAVQAAGSTSSSKPAGKSTSTSKSHSSSGSSSSSRSRSSSDKKGENEAAVPNNESPNLTATNQTTVVQLLENSSATLPASNDTAGIEEQLNRVPAGIYRSESPQIAVDQKGRDDSGSRSEHLMSETNAAGMTAGLNSQADNEESSEAENAGKDGKQETEAIRAAISTHAIPVPPAKSETIVNVKNPDKAETLAKQEMAVKTGTPDRTKTQVEPEIAGKTEKPTREETPNEAETSARPEEAGKTELPDDASMQIKAEATSKIETPVKLEATVEAEKPAGVVTTARSETIGRDRTPVRSAQERSKSAIAIERQESRSKQTSELSSLRAENNEGTAIGRVQSSSSIERERTEKRESAMKASLTASQRSAKLQESQSEKENTIAQERAECSDVAIRAKAPAAPSVSEDGRGVSLSSTTAADSQRDEKSDARLDPTAAGSSLTAQEGKDAVSLSKASASISRIQAQRELKSSRPERSEKKADFRADRTDAQAASKASAATLRTRAQSERMEAKEKASEMAQSAMNARKRQQQESRSRSAAQ